MATSAFGVEDSRIAKSDVQGSTESMLGIAHGRGEHEGKSFRRCDKCHPGAFATNANKATKAASTAETALKVAAR